MSRRALLPLVLALLAAAPATASAATTLAVASGGVASGTCLTTPCEIHYGLAHAAPGDDVFAYPGTYDIGGGLAVPAGVTLHGSAGFSPLLVGTSGGALVSVADGGKLQFLRIRQRSGSRVIDSAASTHTTGVTLENLFVERAGSGSAGSALVTLGDKDTLRDSVVWARPGAETSIGVQLGSLAGTGGATPVAVLRNDTIWTATRGSTAIAALGSCDVDDCSTGTSPILSIRNVIARGGSGGFDLFAFGKTGSGGTGAQKATIVVDRSNYRAAATSSPGATIAAGDGNQTTTDPRLGDTGNGDFRAIPGAPGVDAGLTDSYAGSLDLDGYARPTPGTPPDIGAYERPLPLLGSTTAATGVGATHATFSGALDSHGRPARAYFQFGAVGFGQRTANAEFGPASGSRSHKASVGELEPNRLYHYRLVVVSEGEAAYGADRTLRTAKACIVPDLSRLSLSRAKRGLTRARCRLGNVSKPRRVPRGYTLVVSAQRPGVDSIRPVNSRVNVKLAARRR